MNIKYIMDFILLAFREVKDSYIEENFILIIKEVICEYNIFRVIISIFVFNNVTPNNACVDIFRKSFSWLKEECK
jgi:hypothetical protein